MRFVFYVPASPVARGGISVIMEVIDVLNSNGFEAIALYDRPDFEYDCHVVKAPRVWSASVRKRNMLWGIKPILRMLRDRILSKNRPPASNAALCSEWQIKSSDCVVVPDFSADWLPDLLPRETPLILFNQNPYALINAFSKPGFKGERFTWSLASSEACAAGSRMLLGSEPDLMSLYISQELYGYQQDKKLQVAYMPRKRGRDALPLVKALQATHGIQDIPFIPIDGLATDDAAHLLRESLFFLSLSEREGFGLPAAEAMATGALVIGYTGVGGDEFFTPKTGFPVPEDNLMLLYETAVSVITRYKTSPDSLDELRLRASEAIFQNYPRHRFDQEIIRVFTAFQSGQTAGV